jgi:hypothetical protein
VTSQVSICRGCGNSCPVSPPKRGTNTLVTATVLPTDHQRRLQRSLEENRQRMLIAFSVAQEMISRGERVIRDDLTYEVRYGEVILNMASLSGADGGR